MSSFTNSMSIGLCFSLAMLTQLKLSGSITVVFMAAILKYVSANRTGHIIGC